MSRYSDRSATGRPSWKQRGTGTHPRAPQTANKSFWRWMLTFLLAALLAGFVYWFWPSLRGERHLVANALWATDQLTLPPLAYVREDLDALARIPDVVFQDATGEGQDEDGFAAFADKAARKARGIDDALILYLAAHGGVDEDGPYLTCSEFGRSGNRGRYATRRLLDKLSQSKAGLNLLILDVGRLNYDPRWGIVGNDFTSLLVNEVKSHSSSNVWVCLATRTFDAVGLDYGAKRSVFGRAVAKALAGEATRTGDGEYGDRFVDLREFTQYVQAACRDWFGAEVPNYQSPRLLQTGVGLVTGNAIPNDRRHRLVFVDLDKLLPEEETPSNPEAEPKSAATASLSGKREAPQADTGKSAPSSPPPSSSPPSSPPPSSTPPSSPPPSSPPPGSPLNVAPARSIPDSKLVESLPRTTEQELRFEMGRLWELRDRLRARQAANGVSPSDFAPHIWREGEARLLDYEQRLRSGRIANSLVPGDRTEKEDADRRLGEMRTLATDLERLLAAMNGAVVPGSRDEKSVGDRLLSAWQRYVSERKPADEQFERNAGDLLRDTRQAARRLSDQLHNSVWLARWFGHAATTLPDSDRYRSTLATYLDELAAAVRAWRQLERMPVAATESSRLRQFIDLQRQLAERERKLDEELAAIEQQSLAKSGEPGTPLRIEGLLSTPWLSAARRGNLLDELLRPRRATGTPARTGSAAGQSDGGRRLIAFRRDCLQLEAKLIQIADEEAARRIETLAQPVSSTETQDAEARRLHDGVREVVTFYTALPRSLTSKFTLYLVDPRDAVSVDARKFPLPSFDVEMESTSELRLISTAQLLQLQQDQPTTLSVTLRATKRNLLDARLVPINREGLLSFELLPQEEELPPERGWHAKTVQWRVTAKPEAIGKAKNRTSILITAEAAGIKADATVAVELPQPNRVDVFFSRLGSSDPPTSGASGEITLELFSNRRTRFQCSLANQHDQKKTVQVTLYAIAPRPNARSPFGKLDAAIRRSVFDGDSKEFFDAKPVAKSEKPVELPAADPSQPSPERVMFNWVSPGAAAAAPPAAPVQPPAAATPPSSEPIHGLVLEIVDTKTNTPFPPIWIELKPLSPRDFLDIAIGYEQKRRQIVARLTPKKFDRQRQPELPAGPPVSAEWDPSEAGLPSEGKKNLAGEIDSSTPNPAAVLAAEVEPDGKNRVVKIGIDGYPRAFLYSVSCRLDPTAPDLMPGRDLERETTSIKIDSLTTDPSQTRVYHFLPDFQLPPVDEKAPKVDHIRLAARQPGLFAAPAGTLVVRLQADAPLDAFQGESDRVLVTLRENSFAREIRADRDVRLSYIGCGPRGMVELASTVDDLTVRLSSGTLQNLETVVDADIRFGDRDDTDSVLIQLDGDDPRIERIEIPKTALKDSQVSARFFAGDYHGVGRVFWGFSKDGSIRLVEAETKTSVVTPRLDDDKWHRFDLEIDLKDLAAGRQILLAKVVDHVGHESKLFNRELLIAELPTAPTKGEIRGVLRYGPAPVSGALFKMTIEGGDLGPTPVPIQPDGSFLIRDLPITEYTLKVLAGSFSGKAVPPKEQKGVKPVDPKKPQPITLDVRG